MTYSSICISSGHSTKCQGAVGIINEVAEATRVVDKVYNNLKDSGVKVEKFHDTVSDDQNENLNRIVDWHNSKVRQLDISVHFNANKKTSSPVGTEVWFVTQEGLAAQLSAAIAKSGLKDRGPKYSNNLFFLNGTAMPSVLLEICFVDSEADCKIYKAQFDLICEFIADVLINGGDDGVIPVPPSQAEDVYSVTGKVSHFGGPDDMGVDEDEGLAFIYDIDAAPHLFLPYQPEGTTGLARRLNPHIHYIACRWDYNKVSKTEMLQDVALVRSTKTGIALKAFPADWGPHGDTDRVADISPGLMEDLGITTDDEVEVIFPWREDQV